MGPMPDHTPEYYRSSQAAPPAGVALTLAAAVPAGILGGWAYALGCGWNPFLMMGILSQVRLVRALAWIWKFLAMVVGAAMAAVTLGLGIRSGKLRHSGVTLVAALLAGSCMVLASWHFWLAARGHPAPWAPGELIDVVLGAAGNVPVDFDDDVHDPSGAGLVKIIWAAEAVLILVAVKVMASGTSQEPYCETCQDWMAAQELAKRAPFGRSLEEVAPLGAALKQGDLQPLLALPAAEEMSADFTQAKLYHCEGCGQHLFLSVTVEYCVPSEGEDEDDDHEEWEIVRYLRVDTAHLDALRAPPGEPGRKKSKPDPIEKGPGGGGGGGGDPGGDGGSADGGDGEGDIEGAAAAASLGM